MRFFEVDALKGLAIVGVVIAHINFVGRFDDLTLAYTNYLQLLFGWCVIAFFFASGFLIKRPSEDLQEAYDFIKKKFIRVVIPCFIFSVSYKIILAGIYYTELLAWQSPIPTTMNEVVDFIFAPVGPQFYFLYYLFVIATVVTFLQILLTKTNLLIFSAVLLPVSYVYIEIPQSGYGSDYSLLPLYYFAYVTGYALSSQYKNVKPYFYIIVLMSVLLASIISASLISCYILVPIILLIIFQKAPNFTKLINKTKIGKYSSGIYVWHAPIVLPFISIICVNIIGGQPIVLFPLIVFTIIICCLISLITFKFHSLRFWRF